MNELKEISTLDLFKLYQKYYDIKIIDVRDPFEFDEYHIHKAINIPFDLLVNKHNLFINKANNYFIICQNGKRSKTASIALKKLGYNVVNVVDGIDRWPGLLVSLKNSYFKGF